MENNKNLSPIEQIFDEENNENIFLYDENGKATEFEQIALIPLDERLFVILKPVEKVFDLAEDEALVFEIIEDEEADVTSIEICDDENIINQVFEEYYNLLKEEGLLDSNE